MKIERLETITLGNMLPRVFVSDPKPQSEVWLTSLTFRRGERYLIEAESGAGKSSMCAYIYGSRRDYEGTLLINGENAAQLTIPEIQSLRRSNIAYLPQELDLFPELTAWENIQLKNGLTNRLTDREIEDMLARLGIANRRDYPAGRMSIGQQQRVAIIRTLCQPFDFILLDEPVSHLDETNNRIVADIVEEIASRQGAAIISTSVGNPLLLNDAIKLKL